MKKLIVVTIFVGLSVLLILFWSRRVASSSVQGGIEKPRPELSSENDSRISAFFESDLVGFLTMLDESPDEKLLELWKDRDNSFNGALEELDNAVDNYLTSSGSRLGGTGRIFDQIESPPETREYLVWRFHLMLALLRADRSSLLEQVFLDEVSNPTSEHVVFLIALEVAVSLGDFQNSQFFNLERITLLSRANKLQSQYLALHLIRRGNGGDPTKILNLLDENPWLGNPLLNESVASARGMVVERKGR